MCLLGLCGAAEARSRGSSSAPNTGTPADGAISQAGAARLRPDLSWACCSTGFAQGEAAGRETRQATLACMAAISPECASAGCWV